MFISTQGKHLRPGDRVLLVDGYRTIQAIAPTADSLTVTLAGRYNTVRRLSSESWFYAKRGAERMAR